MSKFKKLIISLSLVLTMMVSMAVGIGVFAPKTKADSSAPEVERDYFAKYRQEDVTYSFEEPVEVKEGTPTIDYSYAPSDDTKAGGAVAYEYVFNNPNTHTIGVDLHKIEAEGVNISYAYLHDMDATLDITSGTSPYKMPNIEAGKSCRIFVIVSPEESDIPAEFTSDIRWNYGKPGKTKFVAGNSELEVDIIKGAPIDMSIIPEAPGDGYYFDTWATDEHFENTLGDNYTNQGGTLYARYANLPDDWIEYNATKGYYQVIRSKQVSTVNTLANITDLVIPSTYQKEGFPKAEVKTTTGGSVGVRDGTFYNQTQLNSVRLPEGLTTIEANTFNNCTSLTSVNIPSSVTTIGTNAFEKCTGITDVYISSITAWCNANWASRSNPLWAATSSPKMYLNNKLLTNLTIPREVTSITSRIFYKCSSLINVEISSEVTKIQSQAFEGCTNLISVKFADNSTLESIEYAAFKSCSRLSSIDIPSTVNNIGQHAFSECSSLVSVKVPRGVSVIDNETFKNCKGLTSLTFEDGSQLTSIKDSAFSGCSGLTGDLIIPDSVTSIGYYAFGNCISLNSFIVGEDSKLINIVQYAFTSCKGLTSVILPNNIQNIGQYAFSSCNALQTITTIGDLDPNIDESVVASIEKCAFSDCANLISVDIPSSINVIKFYVFQRDKKLTTVNFADDSRLTDLGKFDPNYSGSGIFEDCSSLTTVNLENCNELKAIHSGAFRNCTSLKAITIPASVTTIGTGAFSGCQGFTSLIIEPESQLTTIEGSAFYNCKKLTSVLVIPSGVTSIGIYAFAYCSGLTGDLKLPSVLTSIGAEAFRGCSGLTGDIVLSSAITVIEKYTFYGCKGLTSLTFAEGSQLTNINESAFSGCSGLTGDLIIPDSVTSIGNYAFSSCKSLSNLRIGEDSQLINIGDSAFTNCEGFASVILPNNVQYIGQYAFSTCVSLRSVTTIGSLDPTSIDESVVATIKVRAFSGCNNLVSVNIPSRINLILNGAFYSLKNLSSVNFAEDSQLKTLGDTTSGCYLGIFEGCTNLTSLVLPASLTTIEGQAFRSWTSLKTLTMLTSVPPTLSVTLPNSVTAIYVPKGSIDAYKTDAKWSTYSTKFVEMD